MHMCKVSMYIYLLFELCRSFLGSFSDDAGGTRGAKRRSASFRSGPRLELFRFSTPPALLAALCILATLSSAPAMAQIVWEDFPGLTSVAPLDTTITNRYPNNTPPASLNALKTFSNNAANSVRSGTSTTFTYTTLSATLCDTTSNIPNAGVNSPPCLRDVMGRVMWARIQFPEAGNYNFSLAHDDEVDIDISSNYASNSYKSISYNLGVGELASYTSGDTAYEALPGTVYAPVANSCGWIRVYWNNAGGINHLQLR